MADKKVITETQFHRLLEDLETIALSARLLNQVVEAFGRDFQGMLEGNKNKGGSK